MSFTNTIPNFTIMAPKDFNELEEMLEFSVNLQKPVLLRYPRGTESMNFGKSNLNIEYGKAEVLETGRDVTIVSIGKMVSRATEVSNILKESDIQTTVINARFLKPFDEKTLLENINNLIVTIEDGTIVGGLGSKVEEVLQANKIQIDLEKIAYPDSFIKHGNVNEIEEKYGLDAKSISENIKDILELSKIKKITNIKKR